jgi:hypothetical protein
MLSEERKEEIRQTLVEMAKTRRHASAMLWISGLPIEEEEYARSIFGEVEQVAAGGPWNMSSMRVPVSNVWDKPTSADLHSFSLNAVRDAIERLGLGVRDALDALGKLESLKPIDPTSIQQMTDRLSAIINYGPPRKQDDMLDSANYREKGLSTYKQEQIVFHKALDGKWVRENQGNTSKDGEAGE